MERLTKRTNDGRIEYNCLGTGRWVTGSELLRVWGEKLAAFEDTGLEPKAITVDKPGCVFYCNRKCNVDGRWCSFYQEWQTCPWKVSPEKALQSLLAEKTNLPLAPLTPEELRAMEGEAIWYVELPRKRGFWAIIAGLEDSEACEGCDGPGVWLTFLDCQDYGIWAEYNQTWVAYRRKPEEPIEIPMKQENQSDKPEGWRSWMQGRFERRR